MRKIVLKTAIITLGVTIILAVAVFGIVSLIAPAQMMRLTLSLGLDRIGADYAFQEYERSGDVDYLARSFEICAAGGYDDNTAVLRGQGRWGLDERDRLEGNRRQDGVSAA